MGDRLDEQLHRLAALPVAADLSQLEAQVWRRISDSETAAPSWRWQAGAAALALSLGLAVSATGAPAARRAEIAVFSPDAPLAPSTLLDAGR